MGNFISGNIVKIIYESNSGPYKVGIFRVRETNDKSLESYLNKNIGIYKGKVENIVLRLYTLSINRRRDKKSIRK